MIGLFSNLDFLVIWLVQILTQWGSNLLSFVLALRIFELTKSNTAVGILMLMFGLPTFLFGLGAGIISDRFNKLKLILMVELSLTLLVIIFYFSSESIIVIYTLMFLFSIMLQFFLPSIASLVPTVVSQEKLLSANSIFTMTFYITVILGYVGAGPLLRLLGSHNIFLLIGSLFFVSALIVNQKKAGGATQRFSRERLKILNPFLESGIFIEVVGGIRETVTLVVKNLRIRTSLGLLVFSQIMITTLLSLSPGFAATVLGIDVTDSSLYVILPAAVGMFSSSIFLGFFGRKVLRKTLIKIGLFNIFVVLLVLSFSRVLSINKVGIVFLLVLIFGGSNAFLEIPANTTLQEEAKEFRGRVYGLLGTLVYGASSLPLLITGLAADHFGVSKVIMLLSLVTFSALLIFLKGDWLPNSD